MKAKEEKTFVRAFASLTRATPKATARRERGYGHAEAGNLGYRRGVGRVARIPLAIDRLLMWVYNRTSEIKKEKGGNVIMEDRTEFGHLFHAVDGHGNHPYWKSTSGKEVIIIPSSKYSSLWFVFVVPDGELLCFTGEDVEQRAFCVAEGYTRQK